MRKWIDIQHNKSIKFTIPPPDKDFLLSLPKKTKVLDAGCGHGRVLKYLSDLGFKNLTGFDVSRVYIDRARQVCPAAKFFISSFEDFEPKDKYDLILLIGIIDYILTDKGQDVFFEKISRGLSSTGYVLLKTFVVDFKKGWLRYLLGFINTVHFGRFQNSKGFECHHQAVKFLRKVLQSHFSIEFDRGDNYLTWDGSLCRGHCFILRPKHEH